MLEAVVVRDASADDHDGIARIDGSYRTNRILRIERDELAFRLTPVGVDPPIVKTYPPPLPLAGEHYLLAEVGERIVGYVKTDFDEWSRRLTILDLAVDADHRGQGIGRALIETVADRGRSVSARCLWLETQNTNVPAIEFYRRLGFRLCGLDDTLYSPTMPGVLPDEVALYFARDLSSTSN